MTDNMKIFTDTVIEENIKNIKKFFKKYKIISIHQDNRDNPFLMDSRTKTKRPYSNQLYGCYYKAINEQYKGRSCPSGIEFLFMSNTKVILGMTFKLNIMNVDEFYNYVGDKVVEIFNQL